MNAPAPLSRSKVDGGVNLPPGYLIALLGPVAAVVFAIALIPNRSSWLSEKFHSDAELIQLGAQGRPPYDLGTSYAAVASIYQWAGLADRPILAGYASFFISVLVAAWLMTRFRRVRAPMSILLISVFLALSGVFTGTYAKDAFVIPFLAPAFAATETKRAERRFIVGALIYAALFRRYWFIAVALYLALRLIHQNRIRFGLLAITATAGIIAASLVITVVQGVTPDHYRTVVNVGRISTNTLLPQYISSPQPLAGVANNIITGYMLIIPTPLFVRGAVYHIVLAILISSLWVLFFRNAQCIFSATRGELDPISKRTIIFMVAFVATQAIFEPDYGSYLRHLTPLLLIHAWVSYRAGELRLSQAPNIAQHRN